MPESPSIRANWSKYALRHLHRLPAPKRDAVLAEIGDASLSQIGSAGVLAWLPAEHHARIFDAVHSVLGDTGASAFWRDLMSKSLEQPILRPLVQGGLRLFGGTPYSVYRMSPRAWSLVARDCGVHSVARGEGAVEARIQFDRLPRFLETPGFIGLCVGNCEAVLRFLGVHGTIALMPSAPVGTLAVDVADIHAATVAS